MSAAVVVAVAVLLVVLPDAATEAGDGAGTAERGAPRPFVAYRQDSYFTTPLPDDAPIDPASASGIALTKAGDASPYPLIRGVDDEWGMPYALGTCTDPVWRLTGDVPAAVAFLRTEGFHAPTDFVDTLTGTSDSPFVVIDRCGSPTMPHGMTVWAHDGGADGDRTIDVRSAGAFQHDSNGLDRRNTRSDSALNFRSRGAIPDAMVIRDDLLAWAIANDGDLGHVLHMFWWETDSSAGAVHPMVGDESGKDGFGAEGMRIRIRPDVDLNARDCSPAGLVVARTLQRYGAYLGDNAGHASGIKAEQGSEAITTDALSCVRWDDFAFVRRGWAG